MRKDITDAMILRLARQGMTINQASELLGCKYGIVYNRAKNLGVDLLFIANKGKRIESDFAKIKEYALKGMIAAEAANAIGYGKAKAWRAQNNDPALAALFRLNKRVRAEWGVNAPNKLLPEQKFWAQVDKRSDPRGCWEYKGTITPMFYGRVSYKELLDRFGFKGRSTHSHRMAYALHYGSIDHDLDVDHLCHNRKCCNPAHLRQCTRAENSKRRWHHVMGERPSNMPPLKPLIEHLPKGRNAKSLQNYESQAF